MNIYCHTDGRKFVCTDYKKLTAELVEALGKSDFDHGYLVHWSDYKSHTIVFDVNRSKPVDLLRYFDEKFLPVLKEHLTCLSEVLVLASLRRDGSGGLHVHLPGVTISHDDYVQLCDRMRGETRDDGVRLDCPSSMVLVASDKPSGSTGGGLYVPRRLVRVRRDDDDEELPASEVARLMMPIEDPESRPTRLFYPTRISTETTNETTKVASFTSRNCKFYICKEARLERDDDDDHESFCHRFLKRYVVEKFSSRNQILKTWFKRYSPPTDEGPFGYINSRLRRECVHLRDEKDPLRTVLKSWLPAFYALCNLKKNRLTPEAIASHFGLENRSPLPPESQQLTFDTILYCASKTVSSVTKEGFFLKHIGKDWNWIFESVLDMKPFVRFVQKLYFPIVRERDAVYTWDPFIDRWCRLDEEAKIRTILECVVDHMKFFDGYNGKLPSDDDFASMQKEILAELLSEEVEGSTLKDRSMYGDNVPEYYFFEGYSSEDTCCCL